MAETQLYPGEILRCIVGSKVYGLDTVDSDTDIKSVHISPREELLGVGREQEVRKITVDDHSYSLRHFARLAVKCVPTVLELLFSEQDNTLNITTQGEILRAHRHWFLSKNCVQPYIGYAQGQLEKAAKVPTNRGLGRQEMVEKYGYDCYSSDTEFLTTEGWKTYDEITEGDLLGTINPQTRQFEFQRFFERVKKTYSGPMINYSGGKFNFLVTPNHRIFAWDMKRRSQGTSHYYQDSPTAGELYFAPHNKRLIEKYLLLASHRKKGNARTFDCDNCSISSEDFFLLAGMYLSEGCVGKRLQNGDPSVLRLSQSPNGKMVKPLRALATKIPFVKIREWDKRKDKDELVIFISDRKLSLKIVGMFGEKKNKNIPYNYDFIQEEVEALFYGMWLGDGSVNGKSLCYHSKLERLIDSLQAILSTSGYYTHKSCFPRSRGMYYLHVDKGRFFAASKGGNVEEVDYEGDVVCFSVPNETLVTRRRGYVAFQGNTKFAMHTIRVLQTAEELLTTCNLKVLRPNRDFLLDVRYGRAFPSYDEFRQFSLALIENLRKLEKMTQLPEEPDIDAINELIINLHESHWNIVRLT